MLRASTRKRWLNRVRVRARGRRLPTWYAPEYRPPLTATTHTSGFEPRRADLALWYLLDAGLLDADDLHTPRAVTWADVGRVHSPALIEELTHPERLAAIYHAQPEEMPVDEMLRTLRLATGGTLAAARYAMEHGGPTLNLLGGFHHAGPDVAGGLCAINDVAIAVQVLRAQGFEGQVVVLDLDAHPPDGTADCIGADERVFIGSLSGSDWGAVHHADETLLPPGTDDDGYLEALGSLLRRTPDADLAIVLAGGDVLGSDPLGTLGLTLAGAARRDELVAEHLGGGPSVWLPAGGYTTDAWRALAGTAAVLALGSAHCIPDEADPLARRYAWIARHLEGLDGSTDDDAWFTEEDVAEMFGAPGASGEMRLLGYYTASGIEVALSRYGILDHVRRLGYADPYVELGRDPAGDIYRVRGHAEGEDHVLFESSLSKERFGDDLVLYVNWLSMRHPLAHFSVDRPRLPGQDVPGLGMAREAAVLLQTVAARLGLAAVAFRPASYHVAYACRRGFSFADPDRQGRFLALQDALGDRPLLDATRLVDQGHIALDGAPYVWEADLMARWLKPHERIDEARVQAARAAATFDVVGAAT